MIIWKEANGKPILAIIGHRPETERETKRDGEGDEERQRRDRERDKDILAACLLTMMSDSCVSICPAISAITIMMKPNYLLTVETELSSPDHPQSLERRYKLAVRPLCSLLFHLSAVLCSAPLIQSLLSVTDWNSLRDVYRQINPSHKSNTQPDISAQAVSTRRSLCLLHCTLLCKSSG